MTKSSTSIDIEGIAWNTKEEEIKRVVSEYGTVKKVRINHRKDLSPGSAFVELSSTNEAVQAVLNVTGKLLNGHSMKVSLHTKQTKEDKKRIRMWYVEREQERRKVFYASKQDKKQKKREKQRRKRLRKFGTASRVKMPSKGTKEANNAAEEEGEGKEHTEWG